MPWSSGVWMRLGEQLVARRVQLRSEWSVRRRFTDDTGVDYRVVYDIEKARRTNFSDGTLRRLEKAYGLRAGAIPAILSGDDMQAWAVETTSGLTTRIVRDGQLDVFLAQARDAMQQLSPQQREEIERTTIRLLRGMLRDMGAEI